MGKKALCYVEFAVVNFVGRIKTAIKKSFQTYSIYSSTYAREFMEKWPNYAPLSKLKKPIWQRKNFQTFSGYILYI